MDQTSKFRHYLNMAWSGAGMFLLLFLALIFLMFVLDKVGLDREVMRVALLAPVFFAIYRMGVLKAFLGGTLITVIVAAPLVLLHYTPLGEGIFKWMNEVFPGFL